MPTRKPWKPHPNARTCAYAGCRDPYKPGMQPLRLNGVRGFWHLKCFELAKREAAKNAELLRRHLISDDDAVFDAEQTRTPNQ